MENKNNFAGIIIPVIVAVILLTVLPIINSINPDCPPCEECPIYNIGNMEVNPDFSSGNYTVDKGSYDYLDNVTIIKDDNLIAENIKNGIDIFGVEGTYEEEGLPFSEGMGVLFVSGHHSNGSGSTEILPPEGRIVCNDGSDDLYIDGTLISFSQPTGREAINYSFIFLIPIGYTIKEFELKSHINWDRDYKSSVASFIASSVVSSIDISMDSGYTTPNQFSRIFSFTTPQSIGIFKNSISVTLATYKD